MRSFLSLVISMQVCHAQHLSCSEVKGLWQERCCDGGNFQEIFDIPTSNTSVTAPLTCEDVKSNWRTECKDPAISSPYDCSLDDDSTLFHIPSAVARVNDINVLDLYRFQLDSVYAYTNPANLMDDGEFDCQFDNPYEPFPITFGNGKITDRNGNVYDCYEGVNVTDKSGRHMFVCQTETMQWNETGYYLENNANWPAPAEPVPDTEEVNIVLFLVRNLPVPNPPFGSSDAHVYVVQYGFQFPNSADMTLLDTFPNPTMHFIAQSHGTYVAITPAPVTSMAHNNSFPLGVTSLGGYVFGPHCGRLISGCADGAEFGGLLQSVQDEVRLRSLACLEGGGIITPRP